MPRVRFYSPLNGGDFVTGIVVGWTQGAHGTYGIVASGGKFYMIPLADLEHVGFTE